MYIGLKHNNKYDIYAAILTILIGGMQLIEFGLWRSQDCSYMNHKISLFIIFYLYLQVIIISIVSIKFFATTSSNILSYFIIFACIIFTLLIIYILNWLNKKKLCSKPSINSCRLVWAPFSIMYKNSSGIILLALFLFFYFLLACYSIAIQSIKGALQYPLRYSILPITYMVSLIYSIMTEGKYFVDIVGSFWCFNAIAFGIVSCLHI
jgi:hypothetical protein